MCNQTDLCSEHPMSPEGGGTVLLTNLACLLWCHYSNSTFSSVWKCRLLWKLDMFPEFFWSATSICWFLLWNGKHYLFPWSDDCNSSWVKIY